MWGKGTPSLMRALAVIGGLTFVYLSAVLWFSLAMPGPRLWAVPADFSSAQMRSAAKMEGHVRHLAGDIGPRHAGAPESILATLDYLEASWTMDDLRPTRHRFGPDNEDFYNVELTIPGTDLAHEWVVIGAHYDTEPQTPGANDNASGVAVLLELGQRLHKQRFRRSIRLVAFANEEYPWGMTENMGSFAYARRCHERGEDVYAMLSLDSVGYFDDQEGSQRYPEPLGLYYGRKGDYLALVGDWSSAWLVRRSISAFRNSTRLPSEGSALPRMFRDIARSDHSSFWRFGYPAILLTDTAPFRDPTYHRPDDTPEHLDFKRLSLVLDGVENIARDLAESYVKID